MAFFTFLSAIAILCCVIPMWWHTRNRNLACCYLIGWLVVSNLMGFVNSIIWPNDDKIFNGWDGAVLCDIEVKLLVAANAGQCGCVAAIARNLALILSSSSCVYTNKATKIRRNVIDILFAFGVPVYMMSVHYIVQPNRYYLMGGIGCMAPVDNSWPSIVLLFIWPLALTLAAVYYSALVVWRIHKHRKEFSKILRNSNSNITTSRFVRLFLVSCTLMFVYAPINTYIFYLNVSVPRLPYSWKEIHNDHWGFIYRFPSNPAANFNKYAPLIGAYMVFFFFGIGSDAMSVYRGLTSTMGIDKYVGSWSEGFMGKFNSFTDTIKKSTTWSFSTSFHSRSPSVRTRNSSPISPTSSANSSPISQKSIPGPRLHLDPVSRFEITAFEAENVYSFSMSAMGIEQPTPLRNVVAEKV